ncbi:MAG TPA: dihydroorotate dehydrogenase electron transfer subunit [Candidatus Deferrimicrobiaceae bacterium]|nr:dihydroorotate dehydrogenase electron transfer subunit [Candidatus Deferrimicrobiaceae bacterium]
MSPSRMRFAAGRIVRNEGHGEIFYRLEAAVPEPVEFDPGQFAMVSGWPGNDPLLPRPLAIFRSGKGPKGKGTVEFVYKVVGRGTALLSGLHPGEPLSLTLPLGRGFDLGKEGRRYWLVGGGVGFATVFPAAAVLARRKAEFEMYLGSRTRDQLPPKEWTPGGETRGRVHLCTEDGTAGSFGRVTDIVKERMAALSGAEASRLTILACGPREMLKEIARAAASLGSEMQAALENHMACGFGVCWGCVVALREGEKTGYRRVCKEGPVFDAREVVW